MNENFFYSKIIKAKDGNLIPLCKNTENGQEFSLHSKYNPVREAELFCSNIDTNFTFFVVLGLAAAFHIEKLLEKVPNAKIFVVECSESAINFLLQLPTVKKINENKRIFISDIENLEKNFLSIYKPALHGNLTIISLRQWENIFQKSAKCAREKLNSTIKLLSADYSVQSHFGKIWQKNILTNLSLAKKSKSVEIVKEEIFPYIKKTAVIIAAGPSLDEKIHELKKNQEKYFIIATDTAFSALLKQGVESDVVVSIDGQMVSHEHYIGHLQKKSLYVFDLCANSSAVRKTLSKTENVLFVETGHPLAQYASIFSGKQNFLHVETGSGTVTIAAFSLAQKLGFKKIEFLAADFAYIDGKPYTRGTYLENQFYTKSNRICTAEKSYITLMYRAPIKKISENKITTEILEAYRTSLLNFIKESKENKNFQGSENYGTFDLGRFKSQYCKDLRKTFKSENDFDENSPAIKTLLPLCAKLGKGSTFLAYLKTLRYTERV